MSSPEPSPMRKITRRTFLKRSSLSALGFLGLCSLPFYSYYKERIWLETVKLELGFASLPLEFDGLKIIHFSDVHYGFHYEAESLQSLIQTITALKPDLIVYTGDLYDGPVLPYVQDSVNLLKQLQAPLGKFAVPGNHDYYTGRRLAIEAYEQSGFNLLINRSVLLKQGDAQIQLVGVDDMLLGRPDLNSAFGGLDSNLFTLFLAHEPDFADRTAAFRVDLQMSGHSHGGQVRLPFIGELTTPLGGRVYVQGLYQLENRDTPSYVYTSRGIGTTHIPIRFLCRPELTLITLKHLTN